MPIYAYRCTSCGHAQDVLRKISDPPLIDCPACGAATYTKQVTAAGFQLKGSGWYVTDFRGGSGAVQPPADGAKAEGAKSTGDAIGAGATAKTAEAAPIATPAAPAASPAPAPAQAPTSSAS